MGIEELSVISGNISWARSARALPAERNAVGCWIASIKGPALDNAKRCGSVCHCPGVRSDRVLRMRNRHHACAANETHSGFESDHTIRVTRTNDAAFRFAPQRHSGKVGRSGRARAGAGAAWIAIEE